jgi:hypothetical protein
MNASARQSLVAPGQGQTRTRSNGDGRTNIGIDENAEQPKGEGLPGSKPRVFVAAENRLLREALSRMLVKAAISKWPRCTRRDPFERKIC